MEEEINLRELIEVLLRGKWVIAGITALAVLAAGLISFFVLPEKYEASASILFDKKFIEEQGISLAGYSGFVTDYSRIKSVFEELQLDKEDYTLNGFKNSIQTETDEEAGNIQITVKGTDPVMIKKAANLLGESSVTDLKERLISQKEREINERKQMLQDIEKRLEGTPELLGSFEVEDRTAQQVVQIPKINPLYEKLTGKLDSLSYSISELEAQKESLQKELNRGSDEMNIIFREAHTPLEPVGPRSLLNVAVAFVLGLMLSVFIVFFREFWRNSEPGTIDASV